MKHASRAVLPAQRRVVVRDVHPRLADGAADRVSRHDGRARDLQRHGWRFAGPPRELQALAQDDFAAQVKQALKDFADDDALRANPLSGCRVAHDLEAWPLPLRHAIELAAESLTRSGKDELAHGAVKLTYLDPTRTQEEAAERLDLAFSTYRRHLARGVSRMTRWLWERDLYGYARSGVES